VGEKYPFSSSRERVIKENRVFIDNMKGEDAP
jgi:hypothetical protein